MEESKLFAIETFRSTDEGKVFDVPYWSHYINNFEAVKMSLWNSKAKAIVNEITIRFVTLTFYRKWLEETFPRNIAPLK